MNYSTRNIAGFILSFLFVASCISVSAQSTTASSILPEEAWGVQSWASYRSSQVSRILCPDIKGAPLLLHWDNLEPHKGEFDFEGQIGEKLVELDQNDFYTFITVWVAFATSQVSETDTSWAFTPRWLFDNGVPLVEMEETISPLGVPSRRDSPYFFDEDYIFYYYRMIDSLGHYLLHLPDHLKRRVLFIQSAEGSTGDEGPYKGDPVDPQYNISTSEWSVFRIQAWERYKSALSKDGILQFPIMTNASRTEQFEWMLDNLPLAIGDKGGMFSHGYHISDAQARLADAQELRDQVEARGKIYYARGEMDAEYSVYGWSTQNIPQALYWSSIYAVNGGLNIWNLPSEACQGDTYSDAIHFFNRYAKQRRPGSSKVAFCALRRGLDASDTRSFPESIFGKAEKSNTQRYINIANAFSEYGANQGDPEKATGGGMVNRKREDYNDVGWKILPGNYHLNLKQIDADQTSVAWWQVDRSVYGRFARGFDASRGMNTMFFDADDHYFEGNRSAENGRLKVKVIYKAGDGGSWELLYHAKDGTMKSACMVQNDENSDWLTKEVFIDDALLDNGGPKGADLILQNLGNTNCRFHMIELERDLVISANESIEVTAVSIDDPLSELLQGATRQLSATVMPENAGNQAVNWTSSNSAILAVDQWGSLTAVSPGTAEIIAHSSNPLVTDTLSIQVVNTLSDQTPFGGANRSIPGLIEGEDFDDGGQHISFFDTDGGQGSGMDYRPVTEVDLYDKANGSNGLSVGRTREGEWLEYTVDVTEGTYDITVYYYCSAAPGGIKISLDGTILETLNQFENQGDWGVRDSVVTGGIYLPGGEDKILRMEFVNGGSVDIDAIRFSPGTPVDVTGVVLENCPSGQLVPGDLHTLSATVMPANASNQGIAWSSSDETIATVDAQGMIRALSGGTVNISVSTMEGGYTAFCAIQVEEIVPLVGLTIGNCPPDSIAVGVPYQLAASVVPDDASDQTLVWSTYDAAIATVDTTGLVTPLSEGKVVISVAAPGGITNQCEVTVYQPYFPVTGISLEGCIEDELVIGTTLQLEVQIDPFNATYQSVTWSSSDEQVIVVDAHGLVEPVGPGVATVTVTSNDVNLTAECTITVIPVPVTSFELYNCTANALQVGAEHPLGTRITPDNAGDKSISWTSSDTAVATVDAAGVITAISVGNSTITATTHNGGFTDNCEVTVVDTTVSSASEIALASGSISVYPNPASDRVYLRFPEDTGRKYIKVYGLKGQMYLYESTSDPKFSFDVKEFRTEKILLITVIMENNVSNFKILTE